MFEITDVFFPLMYHSLFWVGFVNLALSLFDKERNSKSEYFAFAGLFFLASAVLKYITSG